MPRDPRAWLWDVQEASGSIQSFVNGMDASAYVASELVRAAVERKFEVIGESLSQLSKSEPALAARVPDLPKIVAFRNLLIHGYANVRHDTVWSAIHDSLPLLRQAVEELLIELGSEGKTN
ncbi:DUF86 domain-containing protein [Ramlibacter sp. G-1-2-2]|uniref:DUF86 domain-containing protein n=2 Tax=Ramlibacter agri TaxID=2728837 RepID=A0A848GYN8_9BURK|nr:HepT-like ribonuclease domain-containing protein [Ramlibacter agri]NML42511.1 DUF86 domain-containing protein [Ramlibacter agri]